MKKRWLLILPALLLALCCACGTAAPKETAPPPTSAPAPTEAPPERTLHQELTDRVTESFTYNFDEADWYPYVDHLAVYDSSDEGRYLEIVFDLSSGAAAKNHIRTVVDAMYGNYVVDNTQKDMGIEKVVGVDLDGMVWYSRDHLG